MRQLFEDIDVADANLTGFASNVTGATFTLTANAPTDGLAHQVSIKNDTANDHSGKTVTLVGTDSDGRAQTEVVTAPGVSATVESTKYFKTLTSATPSASIGADTFDIGWVDEVLSRTIFLEHHGQQAPLVSFNITGTLDMTIEVSISPREHWALDSTWAPLWQPTGTNGLVNATSNSASPDILEIGLTACRIKLNSYSSGAEVQVIIADSDSTQ